MVALVPAGHNWDKKKYVVAKDFADENLIIHSLPLETVTVHQLVLKPAGVSPKKLIVLPLTEAAVEMVKAEMGVMVMARWALRPYLQHPGLKTIKVGKNGLKRKHFLAVIRNKQRPAYFNQFLDFLQREITVE